MHTFRAGPCVERKKQKIDDNKILYVFIPCAERFDVKIALPSDINANGKYPSRLRLKFQNINQIRDAQVNNPFESHFRIRINIKYKLSN